MPTPDKANLVEQMLSAERLRRSHVTKPLSEWLRDSLRSGLLFGRHDEPLDAYGQRIVRVILTELDASEATTREGDETDALQGNVAPEHTFYARPPATADLDVLEAQWRAHADGLRASREADAGWRWLTKCADDLAAYRRATRAKETRA